MPAAGTRNGATSKAAYAGTVLEARYSGRLQICAKKNTAKKRYAAVIFHYSGFKIRLSAVHTTASPMLRFYSYRYLGHLQSTTNGVKAESW
ncbi:hypothetical protein NPIL_92391 [Nephila pilipes]|uniref:Uncharacterized protein n=1 Tax=Nephila pilipes TaxID=299642 RepID=A0A8X6PAT2_NEPPI|nr:hypothetical protein NPIL_92391 [Nephila pilipes]